VPLVRRVVNGFIADAIVLVVSSIVKIEVGSCQFVTFSVVSHQLPAGLLRFATLANSIENPGGSAC
jgi:hypothetical protein